jgi:HEAT repeat protein
MKRSAQLVATFLFLFNLVNCSMIETSSSRRSLSHSDPAVRRKGLSSLADSKDPKAVEDVAGVLRKDSDAGVRESAADALGKIGAAAAVPTLLYVAQHDDQLTVRHACMKALGKIGGDEAISGIIQIWSVYNGPNDGAIHLSGSEALARVGKAAVPALRNGLSHSEWRVRWMAVGTLRQIKDPSVRPDIEKLVEDPHSLVRNEAKSALDALK